MEFESFPFEVLQIFGDYIYRVGRTLTVLELVQFFEFCHFLGLERVCKGRGSPNDFHVRNQRELSSKNHRESPCKDIIFELCRVVEKKYNTCEVSLEGIDLRTFATITFLTQQNSINVR